MGKHKCKSGACIDQHLTCDKSNDCFDMSDEDSALCILYPQRCDFERGLCAEWIQDIDSTASWVVHQASPDAVGSLPTMDHSLATSDG